MTLQPIALDRKSAAGFVLLPESTVDNQVHENKSTMIPKVVGPEYLVQLTHRTIDTIKVDARRKPESLPLAW